MSTAASDGTGSVGVGVLGARSMIATRAVMPAIDSSDHVRIAAVSSLSGPVPAPWTRLGAGTYDDVINHADVEFVYIPLPNGMHLEWVERAVTAGKHVLCEKPIALSPHDARRMAELAESSGVLLAEAWMTPFDARWSAAMSIARSGALGPIIDIDASFTFTIGPEADANYRWSPEQGGGALLDVGIYCLGPIVELWDATPDVVDATALWHSGGVDARTEATLEWSDGRQARIRCSFVDAEEQRIEIIGERASLVLATDAHTGGKRADSILIAHHDGKVETQRVTPSDPYLGMVETFARAVRGVSPWPRPMSATIDLLTLLQRIEQASR